MMLASWVEGLAGGKPAVLHFPSKKLKSPEMEVILLTLPLWLKKSMGSTHFGCLPGAARIPGGFQQHLVGSQKVGF